MKAFNPRQGLLLLLALFALRWVAHFVLFSDGAAVAELAALDAAAVVVLILSFALGPNVGAHVGSILAYVVSIGLVLGGIGYLAELARSRHLSQMSAFISIMGAGVGLCLATKTWNQAVWVMGLLAVGGGCYGLTRIHQQLDALVIATPYILVAIVFVVTGATRKAEAAVASTPTRD
jgi:hypothetical protein